METYKMMLSEYIKYRREGVVKKYSVSMEKVLKLYPDHMLKDEYRRAIVEAIDSKQSIPPNVLNSLDDMLRSYAFKYHEQLLTDFTAWQDGLLRPFFSEVAKRGEEYHKHYNTRKCELWNSARKRLDEAIQALEGSKGTEHRFDDGIKVNQ